uniref:ParE toxin of type II toxin-antitoxin system, parDE n=1 Tax=Candidatus Kentrum sp. UNK TaxID=2126344 RepID=A0A451A5Z5_9GAMM|nr:MAG: ParE toxin of type II toxin-antitoxin system, parDE [Candidatus Kentron sp. UNK]VFK69106.1 MAG: ParE toxin of type II toxin-antitoxin system, parDE [Candidatus Kentron sp. UNK]
MKYHRFCWFWIFGVGIKLRASGYRLVYQVDEDEVAVYVFSVGKREREIVYRKASERGG